jgi:DNA replication protein DnaC
LHLAQLAWADEHCNVCFFGPPGTGKSHLAIALAIKACQAGHRVAFATAQQWVDASKPPNTATPSTTNSDASSATA